MDTPSWQPSMAVAEMAPLDENRNNNDMWKIQEVTMVCLPRCRFMEVVVMDSSDKIRNKSDQPVGHSELSRNAEAICPAKSLSYGTSRTIAGGAVFYVPPNPHQSQVPPTAYGGDTPRTRGAGTPPRERAV